MHQMEICNPPVLHCVPSNFKYDEILGLDTERGHGMRRAAVKVWDKNRLKTERVSFSLEYLIFYFSAQRVKCHSLDCFDTLLRNSEGGRPAHEICRSWLNLGYFSRGHVLCVCVGCWWLTWGWFSMSLSAVLLLSCGIWKGIEKLSTHHCRCFLTSSRQILDLFFLSYTPLCLVTLDFPQSLFILTDLKGFKSRFPQTPPTCPPAQTMSRLQKESLTIKVSLLGVIIFVQLGFLKIFLFFKALF